MITLEINHEPVPWAAHKGYGKRSYNPRYKEKQFYQWQLKTQFNQQKPISGPVKLSFLFHMPIPKQTPKMKRRQMLNGICHHVSRPDVTNLIKMCEDTLKGIVIDDDSQVIALQAHKIYSETPKTVILIEEAPCLS